MSRSPLYVFNTKDAIYLEVLVQILVERPQLDDQVLRVDDPVLLLVKFGK